MWPPPKGSSVPSFCLVKVPGAARCCMWSNLLKESRMLHVWAQSPYRKSFYDKSTWKSQPCRQLNLLDWQGSTPPWIGPLGCIWHLTGGTWRNCYPCNSSAHITDTTKCTLLFLFCSTVSPKGFFLFVFKDAFIDPKQPIFFAQEKKPSA